jgi:serine/threonine-protein kinase RsbW
MSADRRLVLAADAHTLDAIHDLLDQVWREDATLSAADRYRFETALVEIAGNIVGHTRPSLADGTVTVEVTVSVTPGAVAARVADDGTAVTSVLASEMPAWDAESGRGLPMARALGDVQYERVEQRNVWSLRCPRG